LDLQGVKDYRIRKARLAVVDLFEFILPIMYASLLLSGFVKSITDLSVTPTKDLFATTSNHKLQRFAALPGRNGVGAEVLDALSIPWTNEVPYLFPPVQLIPRVLQKLRTDAVREAVIVFPPWPSQPWWFLLQDSLVKVVELGESSGVLTRSPSLTVEHKLPPGTFAMAKLPPVAGSDG
jgi:hypothetical protein